MRGRGLPPRRMATGLARAGKLAARGMVVLVVLSGAAGGAAAAVSATNSARPVVGPAQNVSGHHLGYWLGRWWQWRLSFHVKHAAPWGRCITHRQRGPVWLLSFEEKSSTTYHWVGNCTVPHNRYVLFPGPIVDCSTVEARPYHASTNRGLRACAKRDWWKMHRHFGGASTMTLDGQAIPDGYIVGSGVFRFTMPARDNMLHVRGHRHGRAAAYGVALLLKPLSRGRHTLRMRQHWHGYPPMVGIMHLTVGS